MKTTFIVKEPRVICVIESFGKKFKGIAQCMPIDTFNEETGKEIALLKAKYKKEKYYYRMTLKEMDDLAKTYRFAVQQIANTAQKQARGISFLKTALEKASQ